MNQLENIERRINLTRKVLELTGENSPDLPIRLKEYACSLKDRFKHTRDLEDINSAISLIKKAIKQTHNKNSIQLFDFQREQAYFSIARYKLTKNEKDLELGIKILEQILNIAAQNPYKLSAILIDLSMCILFRYDEKRDLNDLDTSVKYCKQSCSLIPEDSFEYIYVIDSYAICLLNRFETKGSIDDLELAVELCKGAIHSNPDHIILHKIQNKLGRVFEAVFLKRGSLKDLEDAIYHHRESIKASPNNFKLIYKYYNDLGNVLRIRYEHTKKSNDLNNSIKQFKAAINLVSKSSSDYLIINANLGRALNIYYKATDDDAILDESISVLEATIRETTENQIELPGYLNSLSIALIDRYNCFSDPKDIEKAILASEKSVTLTAENSIDLPRHLNTLGVAFEKKYDRYSKSNDYENAIKTYKKAALETPSIAIEMKLMSSKNWLNFAFLVGNWPEVVKAYKIVDQAADDLTSIQLIRDDKGLWLQEIQGIVVKAAYAFYRCHDHKNAVVTLEKGIARLLSETLIIDRANIEQLLNTKYAHIVKEYRIHANKWFNLSQKKALLPSEYQALKSSREKLKTTINTIRQLKGYETFLTHPAEKIITKIKKNNCHIYILSTDKGGLALIVEENQIRPVSLPKLKASNLLLEINKFLVGKEQELSIFLDIIKKLCYWIWNSAMEPIFNSLSDNIEKAVLIPTGYITLLPLHAAAREKNSFSPTKVTYAIDLITLAYAPNLLSFKEANIIADRVKSDKLLVIDNPTLDLPNSDFETKSASMFFNHQILRHKQASCKMVLRFLSNCNILHLSCHGRANYFDPLLSGLLMSDGEIVVQDLMELRLKGIRLAILSACETGITGIKLQDEMISFPAALLQAGVAGVISTLWSVDELSTALLISKFYELWNKDLKDPLKALKYSQIWLRKVSGLSLADICKNKISDSNPMINEKISYFKTLKNEAPFEHPYYWAGFAFTGA